MFLRSDALTRQLSAPLVDERRQYQCAGKVLGITKEAVEVLRQYHWPGNVRELCNVIQRAIAMGSSDFIGPQDLPAVLAGLEEMTMDEAIHQVRREYLIRAVLAANGNRKRAAKILNIHPKSLQRILKSHGLLGFTRIVSLRRMRS